MNSIFEEESNDHSKPKILNRALTGILFLILFAIFRYFDSGKEAIFSVAIWTFPYLALLLFSTYLRKYRIGRIIHYTISIPADLLLAIGPFINAIGSIFIVYVMVSCISIILFSSLPEYLFNTTISLNATTYMALTATSIVITTAGDRLIKFWNKIQENDTVMLDRQHGIALKILSQKKSKFIVFALYFILLLVFNFCTFNNISLFQTPKIDTAILQSFATFLAFDRLLSNTSLLKATSTTD